jgi:hypothetical protein
MLFLGYAIDFIKRGNALFDFEKTGLPQIPNTFFLCLLGNLQYVTAFENYALHGFRQAHDLVDTDATFIAFVALIASPWPLYFQGSDFIGVKTFF